MFIIFKLNLTNSHWIEGTQPRGKLGNGTVGLVPSIQKHIKGPSAMVETYSRDTTEQTAEMVNVGWTWGPGRGGLDPRVKQQEACLPSQLFFHVELPLLSQPGNILPIILLGSAHTRSPMEPSWTHRFLLGSQGSVYISHEGPVLLCSIICSHAHGFSQLLAGKICAGPWRWLSLNLTTSCTASTGPISQVMKQKLSGVTSLVWGPSAVKQKRWNLNQAHLSSEHSALSHHVGQIVKEEYIWNEDNIKVTQDLKASIPIHVSINKLIIHWLSRQSEKNDQVSDLCGKILN